jgi:hypothetical protein
MVATAGQQRHVFGKGTGKGTGKGSLSGGGATGKGSLSGGGANGGGARLPLERTMPKVIFAPGAFVASTEVGALGGGDMGAGGLPHSRSAFAS